MIKTKISLSAAIEDLIEVAKASGTLAKNGKTYIKFNALVWDAPLGDSKNDVSLVKEQTKEQREAKEKDVYIGSGRVFFTANAINNATSAPQASATTNTQTPPPTSKWGL